VTQTKWPPINPERFIEPDRTANDFRWKAVALKRNRFHPVTLPGKANESHQS
jgi:hypothetical protein